MADSMTSGNGSSNGSIPEKHASHSSPITGASRNQSSFDDRPAIIRRSWLVDVYFPPLVRDFQQRTKLEINSWCTIVTLYCSDALRFSVCVKKNSNVTPSDASDDAFHHC